MRIRQTSKPLPADDNVPAATGLPTPRNGGITDWLLTPEEEAEIYGKSLLIVGNISTTSKTPSSDTLASQNRAASRQSPKAGIFPENGFGL